MSRTRTSLGRAVRTPQYRGTAQAPHLPKISDYLVARLRDKDSTRELREASVRTRRHRSSWAAQKTARPR